MAPITESSKNNVVLDRSIRFKNAFIDENGFCTNIVRTGACRCAFRVFNRRTAGPTNAGTLFLHLSVFNITPPHQCTAP
jgi:hypothetical protein